MDQSSLTLLLGILLAIPLWRLYHKIFTVFYRDAFWGIIGELFTAVATGFLLAQFIISVFGSILLVGIGIIIKILIYIIAIVTIYMWGMVIWMIRRKVNPYRAEIPALNGEITKLDHAGISYYPWKTAQLIYKLNKKRSALLYTFLLLFFGTPIIYFACMPIFGLS